MWNPSLKSPIADVISLTSYGARPGHLLGNAAEMQPSVRASQPFHCRCANRDCCWGFLRGSSELPLVRNLFFVRYLHGMCRGMILSDQTKSRGVRLPQSQQVSCPGYVPVRGAQWVQLRAADLSCLHPHGILTAAAFLLWRRFLFREGSLKDLFFVGEMKCTQASLVTPHFGRGLRASGKQPSPIFCRLWMKVCTCL